MKNDSGEVLRVGPVLAKSLTAIMLPPEVPEETIYEYHNLAIQMHTADDIEVNDAQLSLLKDVSKRFPISMASQLLSSLRK